jgi:hypothetical protein
MTFVRKCYGNELYGCRSNLPKPTRMADLSHFVATAWFVTTKAAEATT